MKMYSIIRTICLLAALACLTAAYAAAGYWLVLSAIPGMALLWLLTRSSTPFWRSSTLLSLYVVLAAGGMILGLQPLLVVIGCIGVLGWWDLNDLGQALAEEVPHGPATALARPRVQLLAAASGLSLALAAFTVSFRVRLPFGVVLLLALLVLGCMLYVLRAMRRAA